MEEKIKKNQNEKMELKEFEKKIKELEKKIKELENIKSEDKDEFKNELKKIIEESNSSIKNQEKNINDSLEELSKKFFDYEDKYKVISKNLNDLKVNYNKLQDEITIEYVDIYNLLKMKTTPIGKLIFNLIFKKPKKKNKDTFF